MAFLDWDTILLDKAVLRTRPGPDELLYSDVSPYPAEPLYPAVGNYYNGVLYWGYWTVVANEGKLHLYKNQIEQASYALSAKTSHINGVCSNYTSPVVFKDDKVYYIYITLTQSGSGPYTSTIYVYEYDFATSFLTQVYTAVLNTEASGTNSDNYAHAAIALDESTGKLYTAATCYLLKAGVNTKIFRYDSEGTYEDYVVANTATGVPYIRLQVSNGTIYWGGSNRMDYIPGTDKGSSFGTNVYSNALYGPPRLSKFGLYAYQYGVTQRTLRLAGSGTTWDISSYTDGDCHVWLISQVTSGTFTVLAYKPSTYTVTLLHLESGGTVSAGGTYTLTEDLLGSTKYVMPSSFGDRDRVIPKEALALTSKLFLGFYPPGRDLV